MTEEMIAMLEYRLQHGLTKEEAVKKLQKTYPDKSVVEAVYEYRRRGNSMGCQQPFVLREGEEVAPLVSVDVSNVERFGGTLGSPTFSSNYRRSEMLWVIEANDKIGYNFPGAW